MSPDPYGEFFSPYLAMGNNPVSTVDPDGGKTVRGEYVLPESTINPYDGDRDIERRNAIAEGGAYGDRSVTFDYTRVVDENGNAKLIPGTPSQNVDKINDFYKSIGSSRQIINVNGANYQMTVGNGEKTISGQTYEVDSRGQTVVTSTTYTEGLTLVFGEFQNFESNMRTTNGEFGLLDKGLDFAGKANDVVGAFSKTLGTNGLTAVMISGGKTIGRYSGPTGIVINAGQVFNGFRKDRYTYGFNAQKATASAVGGMAGAWAGFQAGAWAGFEAGFSIGLCFEGVGAIPGAVIGGFLGGFGGAWGGAYGGGKLGGSLISNKKR